MWRDEVPVARNAKGGPIPSSPNSGATRVSNAEGLTTDSILARLKRDNPDLAEQVINGEITANAAARIMGWRKPRVLLTSPESVARKLREFFTKEELNELKELL